MGKTTYLNRTQQNSDSENPLVVQDVDNSNRNSQNTVFGEKMIGIKKPSITAQFQYGIKSDRVVLVNENGGETITEDSLLKVRTGTNIAGSSVVQTRRYLRYVPGQEAYMVFTAVFTQGKENSYQRAGLFDDDNGFFIGYEGTSFQISRRRNGIDVHEDIDLTNIFKTYSLDPTKGNVYKISFGYLGFAAITFEVMNKKGTWATIGKFEYPNSNIVTHITQTNLPARVDAVNTGNNTSMEVRSGSFSCGVVDGGGFDPSARVFNKSTKETPITAGDFALITFRNKTTYNLIANRILTQVLFISASTDVNKLPTWDLYVDSDITNTPTWQDVSIDSVIEISTDATIDTSTGVSQLSWTMNKLDTLFEKVEDLVIELSPGQTATFVINTALGASGTVDLAVRWKELF